MQKLQCELCGGNLVMDDSGDFAVCENCGIKFKKETVKKMVVELSGVVQVDGISNLDNLIKRAFGFLEDANWARANEYLEKVLDLDSENARAYIGKMMAGHQIRRESNLPHCTFIFDNDVDFQKALRCADEAYRASLLGYVGALRDVYHAQLKKIVNSGAGFFGTFQNTFITWRVLVVRGINVLLISDRCLINLPFDERGITNKWEDCSLRRWLNGEFYNTAFSETDKTMISPYNMDGPPSLMDKVFLLSRFEAKHYFSDNDARRTVDLSGSNSCWWLRTPGNLQSNACIVHNDGYVINNCHNVSYTGIGVRPALWVNL